MRTRGWLLAVPLLLAGQGDTARRPATPPAPAPTTTPASATPVSALARTQQRREAAKADHKYDDTFRRYSKRWFGAAFDWRWFKAQGMAESNLDSAATSWVRARAG
jgi:hypothetical protein